MPESLAVQQERLDAQDMRELADTFKALSDETRLQMVTLLLEHEELCVCDFMETLRLTQSKTSRHLRYLYHAGLVQDRREGLWMHYRLSPKLTREQRVIVEAVSKAVGQERKRELRMALEQWTERKGTDRDPQSCSPTSCS
jgi:ArsR family transcriptional regulator